MQELLRKRENEIRRSFLQRSKEMMTRLKLDLPTGKIDVEGEDSLVREVYEDFKTQFVTQGRDSTHLSEELQELIEDARISGAWNEYQRAFTLYQRALEECPKSAD